MAHASFQSTLPARGATGSLSVIVGDLVVSIHAPGEGSDPNIRPHIGHGSQFQSTLPARGATATELSLVMQHGFQSTLPARGATRRHQLFAVRATVSIHAPGEGSDAAAPAFRSAGNGFNPRSRRGERRSCCWRWPAVARFNPRSRRGERRVIKFTNTRLGKVSIHAPGEGSDQQAAEHQCCWIVSIHAPGEGSDAVVTWSWLATSKFQSTLPARGATRIPASNDIPTVFQSTLPARGATGDLPGYDAGAGRFNPRSRRGERLIRARIRRAATWFQSTLPARGATRDALSLLMDIEFQSTLPARGATVARSETGHSMKFQSTLPARGATGNVSAAYISDLVSIHAPGEGSDLTVRQQFVQMLVSIHAPGEGSDIQPGAIDRRRKGFNPRSRRGERR